MVATHDVCGGDPSVEREDGALLYDVRDHDGDATHVQPEEASSNLSVPEPTAVVTTRLGDSRVRQGWAGLRRAARTHAHLGDVVVAVALDLDEARRESEELHKAG